MLCPSPPVSCHTDTPRQFANCVRLELWDLAVVLVADEGHYSSSARHAPSSQRYAMNSQPVQASDLLDIVQSHPLRLGQPARNACPNHIGLHRCVLQDDPVG